MRKTSIFFLLGLLLSFLGFGQSITLRPFSWDNASVYFVLTDRFENGNPANDHSYGRGFDGNGNRYDDPQKVGTFHGGDIIGLTNKIKSGYFDNLGVNALWISAPYEQIHGWVSGKDGGFQHYSYHGYYTLDWTEMDANMGTRDDFREFVDVAHQHGIRVILDIVMNHTGYNTTHDMQAYGFGCLDPNWKGWRPGAGQTWNNIHDFINYDACDNWRNWWGGEWIRAGLPGYPKPGGDEKTMALAGLPDVITEGTSNVSLPPVLNAKWSAAKKQEEMAELDAFFSRTGLPRSPRNHVVKWLTDWVREFGVDGFRVDTEKHVEGPAWKALKDESVLALREWKAKNPTKKLDDLDFWMTAENYGYGMGKSQYHIDYGFNSVINFGFQGQAGNLSQLESLFSNYAQTINTDPQWNVLSYISSHDTKLFDRNNLFNAGTSLLLLPGGIQIFYGDESGRPFGNTATDPEQGTRSYMNWGSINQDLLTHWQKLGQFRRNHIAVGAGSHQKLADTPYTFKREWNQDKVIIAIGASGLTTLQVGTVFPDGTELRDAYSGALTVVSGGKVSISAHSRGIILLERNGSIDESPIVSINPASGNYVDPVNVQITATAKNAPVTIYYTLDGSIPSTSSKVYTAPFTITANTTVKAIAVDSKNKISVVVSNNYTIGNLPNMVVHFKKPSTWSTNVLVHHWSAEPTGALANSVWPGKVMKNDGDGWYSYTLPGITKTSLLFHDNTGKKTVDLSRSGEGWYMNGTWYDKNPETPINKVPVLIVSPKGPYSSVSAFKATLSATDDSGIAPTIYYTLDGSVPTENSLKAIGSITLDISESLTLNALAIDNEGAKSAIQSHPYTVGGSAFTVYFQKPAVWSNYVRIHYWNAQPTGSLANTAWPGVLAKDEGNGWYSFTFNNITSTNFLFHDSQGRQTPDLTRNKNGWFVNGVWYDTDPRIVAGLTIHLRTSWTAPTMHYWNVQPAGVAANTTWPGVRMVSEGDGWWKYTIPNATATNLIFSNNGSSQTANLLRSGEGWYVNGVWYNTKPAINTTAIAFDEAEETSRLNLMQNYPNPTNGTTIIPFSMPKAGVVSLKLYNLQGQVIEVLKEGYTEAGSHQIEYKTNKLSSGVYLYRMETGNQSVYKKMIIGQ